MNAALRLVDLPADFWKASGVQPEPERLIAQAGMLLRGCRQKKSPPFIFGPLCIAKTTGGCRTGKKPALAMRCRNAGPGRASFVAANRL